jgi:hypothetical protein
MTNWEKTAYDEGWEACEDGLTISACPYEDESLKCAWEKGYEECLDYQNAYGYR